MHPKGARDGSPRVKLNEVPTIDATKCIIPSMGYIWQLACIRLVLHDIARRVEETSAWRARTGLIGEDPS